MTTENTPHLLARLEAGFRTDAARLSELELDLTQALRRARQFGKDHGAPDEWNTNWHQHWDYVEGLLGRIRALVREMHGSLAGSEPDRFDKALAAWAVFETEDTKLVATLGLIRQQASGLSAAVRKDWNLLARVLEPHLEAIHAYAQTLRLKLELMKEHSQEDVDHVVQDFFAKLARRVPADGRTADTLEREYDQAFLELQREHHRFLGFMDVVKALFLFVETPEERVSKNRTLTVDEL